MKFSGIGRKLDIVGGLFTLILIILFTSIIVMNQSLKKDALVVNVSGLQRMLTQKMSKEVFYLHYKDSVDFRQLNQAVELFEYNLNNLINGNKSKGINPPMDVLIKKKLFDVREKWIPFKKHIEILEKEMYGVKDDLFTLKSKTEKLLQCSQDVVDAMMENTLPARYIDESGKQRMLSQRMGFFAGRYLKLDTKESLEVINDAKSLYENTIKSFLDDETIKQNPSLLETVDTNYKYWKEYEAYITNFLQREQHINESINYINQNNLILLDTMDEAVSLYTTNSENKNQFFMNVIYALALIAIIITIYTYILTRKIVLHVDNFVNRAKRLATASIDNISHEDMLLEEEEDELQEASLHIRDFVKKVNGAMEHSNDTITKAESVADEVRKITIDMERTVKNLDISEEKKNQFIKKLSGTEDIAIESTENLVSVSKMLKKLQLDLEQMVSK